MMPSSGGGSLMGGGSFVPSSAEGSLPGAGISLSTSLLRGGSGSSRMLGAGSMVGGGAAGRGGRDGVGGSAGVPLSANMHVLVYEDPQDEAGEAGAGGTPLAAPPRAGGAAGGPLGGLAAAPALLLVVGAPRGPGTGAGRAPRALAAGPGGPAPPQGGLAAGGEGGGASSAAATGIPGATATNPYALPALEIFLHKIDGDAFTNASAESRTELLREVGKQVAHELADAGFTVSGLPSVAATSMGGLRHGGGGGGAAGGGIGGLVGPVPLNVSFHLTSIYDHSVFEAMSRVVQKVTPGPQLTPPTENLLNALQAACGAEKVFLFDVVTKLYYATDSNPVQDATYELASDMIEVVVDVGCIYDPAAAADLARAGGGGVEELPRHVRNAPDVGRISTSVVGLSTGMALYMRDVAPYLAVVALVKDDAGAGSGAGGGAGGAEDVDAAAEAGSGGGGGGTAGGDSDGDGLGGGGSRPAFLPRSSLSLSNRALIDYNIRIFAKALANLFAVRFGFADGVVVDVTNLNMRAGASADGAARSLAGSYGGLPLSSSLSRSYGGAGSYMARMASPVAAGAAGATSPTRR